MRVLHVVPGLETGGTEVFLAALLPALRAHGIESKLVCLRKEGAVAGRLAKGGVEVLSLGVDGYVSSALAWPRLRALARRIHPGVVHGWLYHGNLAASLARSAVPTAHLLWSVRHSLVGRLHEKAATRMVIRLGARMSRHVDRIIYNAERLAHQHVQAGFADDKTLVIPNGFDIVKFSPDVASGARSRRAHGFRDEDVLVGIVGRYHPVKGHALFVKAAAIAAGMNPCLRFVMLGRGLTEENPELRAFLRDSGVRDKILLLNERSDVAEILRMMDVYVSASWGEGFPNVVGEAMACGVPCIVTDVGASSELVGDTGAIVPPGSEHQLAAAIAELAARPAALRRQLGAAARDRIARTFTWERSVSAYVDLYSRLYDSAA